MVEQSVVRSKQFALRRTFAKHGASKKSTPITSVGNQGISAFSAGALGEYLAQVPVEIVAIEDSTARRHRHEHVDQLLEAVQSKPETWTRIGTFDLERENGSFPQSLTLYRQRLPEDHPAPNITFDDVIGREVPY